MREIFLLNHTPKSARSALATDNRLNVAGFYGAFAFIALVLFGTLSFHPF
jgi:hypothetical protein